MGAITSIMVAWGIAVADPDLTSQGEPKAWATTDPKVWIAGWGHSGLGVNTRGYEQCFSTSGNGSKDFLDCNGFGPIKTADKSTEPPPSEASFLAQSNEMYIRSCGMPFRCVESIRWSAAHGCNVKTVHESGAWHLGRMTDEPLPFHPIWQGLLANAAIYSVPLYAAIGFVVHTRRSRRQARGLCVACAYPRAGLTPAAPCPECGSTPRS
jgi:hypothetical protein